MAVSLTLKEALESSRLDEFIAQAEAEGVANVSKELFDRTLGAVIAPRQEGQTSRSRGSDGLTGK